jgi:hypothetical protein
MSDPKPGLLETEHFLAATFVIWPTSIL